ncbi:unnamed protein product [Peniophora sp. CBMAI 1063]|nr:unnamed protein product [Peniophora sp. CBMAI 1063]
MALIHVFDHLLARAAWPDPAPRTYLSSAGDACRRRAAGSDVEDAYHPSRWLELLEVVLFTVYDSMGALLLEREQ